MSPEEIDRLGTLEPDEYHLSAEGAQRWFRRLAKEDPARMVAMKRTIYGLADEAEENRHYFQVMRSTWERLREGRPVSDRYVLGLCWFMRDLLEMHDEAQK